MREYVSDPLRRGLTDSNGYVRKTAVMGVLKAVDMGEPAEQFRERLVGMLEDDDLNVVTNVIRVLNEVDIRKGGMEVTRPVMMSLLNRLSRFNEFGLAEVLGLLARYTPQDKNEVYNIMNLLDPLLRTSNSGSVLATIKCFIHLTKGMPEVQTMVYSRVKPPMLTLVASGSPEIVHCLLHHVHHLCLAQPGSFDDAYRQLYVRHNEPTNVKHLKLKILPLLANESNAIDLVTELCEYVSDADVWLGRSAVRAVARVATERAGSGPEGKGVGEIVTGKLVELCGMDAGHVSAEAAKALKDVVRAHPGTR